MWFIVYINVKYNDASPLVLPAQVISLISLDGLLY